MYALYTDGSAMPNPGPCGCGAVLIDDSETIIWTLSEFLGQGTNNIGELTAILRGCSRFAELGLEGELAVYSDSELCVGLVSGSKKTKKPHLQYILDRILEIKATVPFTITWVKAHNNVKFNEIADKLANIAVASSQVRTVSPPPDSPPDSPSASAAEFLPDSPPDSPPPIASAPKSRQYQSSSKYATGSGSGSTYKSYGDQKYKDKDKDTGPKLYIKCSFADKDKVKALGARWDPAKRSWWAADSPANHDKFAEWIV
jgi:ribonuclease HI